MNLGISRRLQIFLMMTALLLGACADRNTNLSGNTPGLEDLSPISPNIVYPEGWNELLIDANSATTKIDGIGHYTTDKNMCQRRGDGVFDVETWNNITRTVNQIVTAEPGAQRCVPSANGSRFYNRGTVEITLLRAGKRSLLEYKNGDICTTIVHAETSQKLMDIIENAITLADKADATDCPNYHP